MVSVFSFQIRGSSHALQMHPVAGQAGRALWTTCSTTSMSSMLLQAMAPRAASFRGHLSAGLMALSSGLKLSGLSAAKKPFMTRLPRPPADQEEPASQPYFRSFACILKVIQWVCMCECSRQLRPRCRLFAHSAATHYRHVLSQVKTMRCTFLRGAAMNSTSS